MRFNRDVRSVFSWRSFEVMVVWFSERVKDCGL